MKVTELPGADDAAERALASAGVPNAEQLSRVDDLAALAERANLPLDRVTQLRDAARGAIEQKLHDAGVRDERALVDADLADLAARTSIGVAELARFRELARRAVGLPDEDARVIVRDGAPEATVRVGDADVDGLAVLASREAFESYHGDAVLLARDDEAGTATARYAGATRAGLPLYRRAPNGEDQRVRVLDVRAHGAPADEPTTRDPFWRRILKR